MSPSITLSLYRKGNVSLVVFISFDTVQQLNLWEESYLMKTLDKFCCEEWQIQCLNRIREWKRYHGPFTKIKNNKQDIGMQYTGSQNEKKKQIKPKQSRGNCSIRKFLFNFCFIPQAWIWEYSVSCSNPSVIDNLFIFLSYILNLWCKDLTGRNHWMFKLNSMNKYNISVFLQYMGQPSRFFASLWSLCNSRNVSCSMQIFPAQRPYPSMIWITVLIQWTCCAAGRNTWDFSRFQ